MAGVRAIAHEVRRQLKAPASWLLVGAFAAASGWAFATSLGVFLDQSSQALASPPLRPINVQQLLVRPYLLQLALVGLFVLPVLTARAYRTGAPLGEGHPDTSGSWRIVLATFAGACGVYAVMLLASSLLVAALFLYGAPEPAPVLSGYLGLSLVGVAFIAVGQFISRLARSSMSAGVATLGVAFVLAATSWLAWSGTPAARAALAPLSVGESLNDFAKGVIDTGHVVSYLAVTMLSLFLTRRSLGVSHSDR